MARSVGCPLESPAMPVKIGGSQLLARVPRACHQCKAAVYVQVAMGQSGVPLKQRSGPCPGGWWPALWVANFDSPAMLVQIEGHCLLATVLHCDMLCMNQAIV